MMPAASPSVAPNAREAASNVAEGRGETRRAWVQRLAREPFVHFALLGALIFAGQRRIAGTPEASSIEVSASKQRALFELFEERQRRAPDAGERAQLIARYVEDEALFREGLRLSLVQTDPMLRAQLIARVRGLLQSELVPALPSDVELGRYYDEHRADYAKPETVSYREYWIHRGPEAGNDARRLMAALREGKEPEPGLPPPTDYSARGEADLVALYDGEVARSLWALPNGSWHELRSERGVHVLRVNGHTPAVQPELSDVREKVRASYLKDQTARTFRAELARLTAQWHVNVAERP